MTPLKRGRPSKPRSDEAVPKNDCTRISRTIVSSATQPSRSRPSTWSPSNELARASIPRTSSALGGGSLHGDRVRIRRSPRRSLSTEDSISDNGRAEVIMAINMTKTTLGCSYFADQTLFISDDVEMSDMDEVGRFLAQIEPTIVLVSSKAPQALYSYLDAHEDIRSRDSTEPKTLLQALPSVDFLFSTAKDRILAFGWQISSDTQATLSTATAWEERQNPSPADLGQEATSFNPIRNAAQINFDSYNSIACAGAILSDINHRRGARALRSHDQVVSPFELVSIRNFSLANTLCIDAETLTSLRIFHPDTHPNAPRSDISSFHSKDKESLSIYGLFQQLTSTTQGRSSLRRIFVRPTTDLEIIRQRQSAISVLLRVGNAAAVDQATSLLRKIPNAKPTIAELQRGTDSTISSKSINRSVWATLKRFSANVIELQHVFMNVEGLSESLVISNMLRDIDQSSLFAVGSLINRVVDFTASSEKQRPCVRSGVNSRLDELKRNYDGMESFLASVKRAIQGEVPPWAANRIKACIILPHIGFLLVVDQVGDTGQPSYEGGLDLQDTWERIYSSGVDNAVAFKTRHMRELDQRFGDIYGAIGDLEVEIIHQLATDVMQHGVSILAASDICGELDAILALALGARKYEMTLPSMTDAPVLSIKGGRHLLQELTVTSFIPNDCALDSASDGLGDVAAAMLITGPNHSGKSVFIKQIAIIVYLAQIRSYVPARRAIVGLTDKILARITTRETVSSNESAFAIDLRQMARAIRCATPQSLVLVDEFGKGTSTYDGAGLMAAVLNHFSGLGAERPRVLVATHFHEVLTNGYVAERNGLKFYHMEVQKNPIPSKLDEQIIYLFKLCCGHNKSSFAAQCAAMNGVPDSIVDRAEELSQLLCDDSGILDAFSGIDTCSGAEIATAERIARRFIEQTYASNNSGRALSPSEIYQDLVRLLSL